MYIVCVFRRFDRWQIANITACSDPNGANHMSTSLHKCQRVKTFSRSFQVIPTRTSSINHCLYIYIYIYTARMFQPYTSLNSSNNLGYYLLTFYSYLSIKQAKSQITNYKLLINLESAVYRLNAEKKKK